MLLIKYSGHYVISFHFHSSSCFELPSPARVATPTQELYRTSSLVNLVEPMSSISSSETIMRTRFEDHLFHGRVELLKRLYSGQY